MKKVKLERQSESKKSPRTLAAANIKRELRAAYPMVKFSVSSYSFAGGDKVSISWEDGITKKQAEKIAGKYSYYGGLDHTDCQIYKDIDDTFGKVKFVSYRREYSDEATEWAKGAAVQVEGDEFGNSDRVNYTLWGRDFTITDEEIAELRRIEREQRDAAHEMWLIENEAHAENNKRDAEREAKEFKEALAAEQKDIIVESNFYQVDKMIKVTFPNMNKNDTITKNDKEIAASSYEQDCKIEAVKVITDAEYKHLVNNFLEDNEIIAGLGGDECIGVEYIGLITIVINNKTREAIAINPQGYSYARYVGKCEQEPKREEPKPQTELEKRTQRAAEALQERAIEQIKEGDYVKPLKTIYEKMEVELDPKKIYLVEEISQLNEGIVISLNGKIIRGKSKRGKRKVVSFQKKYFKVVGSKPETITPAKEARQRVKQYKEVKADDFEVVVCEDAAPIKSSKGVHQHLKEYHDKKQEHFIVITLDGASNIINTHEVFKGTINQSIVHPREVFALAIEDRAAGIIIAHNHPSGTLEASRADKQITERLKEASKLLGVELYDHVIVSTKGYYSFADNGYL